MADHEVFRYTYSPITHILDPDPEGEYVDYEAWKLLSDQFDEVAHELEALKAELEPRG